MDILLSNETRQAIDAFLAKPSHAVGIFAEQGSGKYAVASYIAEKLLNGEGSMPSVDIHIVRPSEKGSISIESIRGITDFLKLKSRTGNAIARVVIIEDAHTLSQEAQNALLKTLEEPPKDSIIILTATSPSQLLETIVSRIKSLPLKPVNKAAAAEFFSDYPKGEIEKAWLISEGRPGLMSALLESQEHPLLPYIDTAKQILTSQKYERLLLVDSLSKQDLYQLFTGLLIVSGTAFKQAVLKQNDTQTQRWHAIRSTVYQARASLATNPNNKLLLTDVMLSI